MKIITQKEFDQIYKEYLSKKDKKSIILMTMFITAALVGYISL